MRISACGSRLLLPLICLTLTATAQKPTPADRLARARATYYTPTANGLTSFNCDLIFDWKDLLTRAGGVDVPDDNPMLRYLNATHLSVTDDLHGKAVLDWSNTATLPDGKEASVAQMKGGLEQMIGGFFQSWNVYMNGGMVPYPDKTVTVTATDTGYLLHSAAGGYSVDENFNPDMLLTEAHVTTKDNDTTAYPKYVDTERGRMISVIRSVYRAPPSAPPAEVTISMEYQPVSSFQIPSVMIADLQNVGVFRMKFAACSVKTTSAKTDIP